MAARLSHLSKGGEARMVDVSAKTATERVAVAEGRVVSQMPEAGEVVRRGWDVRLALSLGPQRVEIPQVVGESERAARINIAQRGLQPLPIVIPQSQGREAYLFRLIPL